MNKDKKGLYAEALAVVLDRYEISKDDLYGKNTEECVEAREAIVVALSDKGLSDRDIAELTGMRRSSVCAIRNRCRVRAATWAAERCIEAIMARFRTCGE